MQDIEILFFPQIQNLPKEEDQTGGTVASNSFVLKPSELFDHLVSKPLG